MYHCWHWFRTFRQTAHDWQRGPACVIRWHDRAVQGPSMMRRSSCVLQQSENLFLSCDIVRTFFFKVLQRWCKDYPLSYDDSRTNQLACRQETATSAPAETSEVNSTTWDETHGSICTAPKPFTVVFENNTATGFVYCLRGKCLYSGAEWLSSSLSQRVAKSQYEMPCVDLRTSDGMYWDERRRMMRRRRTRTRTRTRKTRGRRRTTTKTNKQQEEIKVNPVQLGRINCIEAFKFSVEVWVYMQVGKLIGVFSPVTH